MSTWTGGEPERKGGSDDYRGLIVRLRGTGKVVETVCDLVPVFRETRKHCPHQEGSVNGFKGVCLGFKAL